MRRAAPLSERSANPPFKEINLMKSGQFDKKV
jgi:hypothetical protein